MAKIPPPINAVDSIGELIDKYHESTRVPPRSHLGVSVLGHPCDRWLWLYFRWAVIEKFSGRMLRLFRRGQIEEPQVISDLRAIGIDVRSTGKAQSRVDFSKHVSGSIDGVIYSGVPEAPKAKHVLEIKTHNKKSFDRLIKDGLEKAKPHHFIQMQCYMLGMKIERGLYVAICKDDDSIYPERIRLDRKLAKKYIDRGQRIAMTERMPEPLSTDPTWYQCKYCAAHSFCHKTHLTKEVNCRTCAHATPKDNSTWSCERFESDNIPKDFQQIGCEHHVLHPDLVPWKRKESTNPHEAIYLVEDREIRNGEADANVYGSKELIAGPEVFLNPDVNRIREKFEAQIDGHET